MAFAYDPDTIEVVLRDKSSNPLIGVVKATGAMLFLNGGDRRRVVGAIAAATLAVQLVGPVDATFTIGWNLLVTTATNHSFGVQVSWTDEGGTARTMFIDAETPAAAFPSGAAAIVNANGAIPYAGAMKTIRAKANTAITIATVGTFTTVVYNAEAFIEQLFGA